MAVPIVSFVGTSNSGKTTVIERLLPVLKGRGYRVATVKHDVHGFEMDREGKDSWRHKQAGADTVVLSSPKRIAAIKDVATELDLNEIRLAWIRDADLVLAEGYKRALFPKVEVSLYNAEKELVCRGDEHLVAVVSNRAPSVDVPVFRDEEIGGLADLLVERFLGDGREPEPLEVFLGGKPLFMTPFVRTTLANILRGFLSALKGWDPSRSVEIRLAGGGQS